MLPVSLRPRLSHLLLLLLTPLLLLAPHAAAAEQSCGAPSPPPASPYHFAARPQATRLPPGSTRAATGPGYALLAPDNRVPGAPVPGWAGTVAAWAVVTPALGAHFAMYIVEVKARARMERPTAFTGVVDRLERFFFVLTGALRVDAASAVAGMGGNRSRVLGPGEFLYVAPGDEGVARVSVDKGSEAVVIQVDRVYSAPAGAGLAPKSVVGDTEAVEEEVPAGEVFRLRRLLDGRDRAYDFNVHVMDFSPGEFLASKERHYNQHGLLMLQGEGIYMLGERFVPVQAGDVIWMAPFCTQWYAALGKTSTRYWLYKDIASDPLLQGARS